MGGVSEAKVKWEDIPEDIQDSARDSGYMWEGADEEEVANLILAERQRCAEIAREEGERALDGGLHALVPEVIARCIEGKPVRNEGGYSIRPEPKP